MQNASCIRQSSSSPARLGALLGVAVDGDGVGEVAGEDDEDGDVGDVGDDDASWHDFILA